MKSTLRLFKALPVDEKGTEEPSKTLLHKTIKHGFVFAPEVIYNYPETELYDLVKVIVKEFGLTGEQMNASFHKSWNKVATASIEQLVMEQILHYFTTYGFEAHGIYREDSVYIPREKLEIPDLEVDGFKFVVIKGYTQDQLKAKLIELLGTGIALSDETVKDVIDVATFVEMGASDVEQIKNKEVKVAMYEYLGLVPENPIEFLRYCVYKATGRTLLIKNIGTIKLIKENVTDNIAVLGAFRKYKALYGFEKLAQIFYRFKPLFLAFRTNTKLKRHINKIRKMAVKFHKPMKPDYLNQVTALIKSGKLDKPALAVALSRVNTFRKVRLAYALNFRTADAEAIMYRIRNGKAFAQKFDFVHKKEAQAALDIVIASIAADIEKNVKGKKIFIPDYIRYTMPATEKMFSGYFPTGTSVGVPQDIVAGVHWENTKGHRIDLDMSMVSVSKGKIGWDASYRTSDRGVLFSGDVTDAPKPHGASELIYVERQNPDDLIVMLNFYNSHVGVPVPIKVLVAQERVSRFERNHMVDPNKVITMYKSEITPQSRQKVIGLLTTDEDECRFYFVEAAMGNLRSARGNHIEQSRRYLVDFYKNAISLNGVLVAAGAVLVDDVEDAEIDLSPEALEKDTIINLLR